MAYYDAMITKWGTLTGTTDQKLATLNATTVTGTPQRAILEPSAILNAITFADLAALTQLQVTQLTLLLQGSTIDASQGTSIRAGIQALFSGKATTLANLGALVQPYDSPAIPWWRANGYSGPFSNADLVAAGNLT